MGTRFIFGGLIALLFAASCGYAPVSGTLPGGGNEIRVPTVENRTSYSGLAGPLTGALRKRIAKSGLKVVHDGGAPSLRVTIVKVSGKPGMLTTRNDRLAPVDTIECIVVEYRLVDLRGVVLTDTQSVEVSGRAYSGGSPLAEESLGQRERRALLDKLADAVAERLMESDSLP